MQRASLFLRRGVGVCAVVAFAACGSVGGSNQPDGRPPPDATEPDAAPPIDAGPDAPPPPPPVGTVRELGAAGGRVTGGALVLDVQLGHAFSQRPTVGGALVVRGAAAVTLTPAP